MFHVRSNKHVDGLNYVISNSGKMLESSTIKLAPYSMRTFHVLVTQEMAPVSSIMVWHVDSAGYVVVQSLHFPVEKDGQSLVSWIIQRIIFSMTTQITDVMMRREDFKC